MRKAVLICVLFVVACAASGRYTPTSDYTAQEIEGWKVLVNNELSSDHSELAKDVLKLLRHQLYQITRVVPDEALEELRDVPIWVEYNAPRHPCMCYHPSKEWLKNNDFYPFVRSELQQHDPNMYQLLKKLWKVE